MRYRPNNLEFRVTSERVGSGRTLGISITVHLAILFLLLWQGRVAEYEVRQTLAEEFLDGGGGGGGGEVTYMALLPEPAPFSPNIVVSNNATPQPVPPPLIEVSLADHSIAPEIAVRMASSLPKSDVNRIRGNGLGTAGGSGAGTGSGGGIGSGRGSGIGSGEGPGSGFGDGVVRPPTIRFSYLPPEPRPPSVQGREFRVTLVVDEEGRVAEVEVTPEIPDRDYRKRFLDTMKRFRFDPATLADGSRVSYPTVLSFTL